MTEQDTFTPHAESAQWLIPESWGTGTPSYQPGIFPQEAFVGFPGCGRWSQDDQYWIESPEEQVLFESLDDDGILTQGEDSAIYQSHVFTYGGDCLVYVTPVAPSVQVQECYTGAEEPTITLAETPGITYTVVDIDAVYGDKQVRANQDEGLTIDPVAAQEAGFLPGEGFYYVEVDLGERVECSTEPPVGPPTTSDNPGAPGTPGTVAVVAETAPAAPELAATGMADVTWALIPIALGLAAAGGFLKHRFG